MDKYFQETILKATGATKFYNEELIQDLWSGYGKILRYSLQGSKYKSVIVKHVRFPQGGSHPRGWNTNLSHQRKVKSYQVEMAWYKQYSQECDNTCRVPKCLGQTTQGDEVLMVLEDLDAAGFPERLTQVSWDDINACLSWLANFHATFLNCEQSNLWAVGTYWHLDTRPDELEELSDEKLKAAAELIDEKLKTSKYQTLVHGDAKLANFCFAKNGYKVAAVDFQYVGHGCGMKDVAYFIGSCLYEDDCERYEAKLLDNYFNALREACETHKVELDYNDLESEWRKMFPLAWTDFHRFLKGWSPGHWKINSYSERLSQQVLMQIEVEDK